MAKLDDETRRAQAVRGRPLTKRETELVDAALENLQEHDKVEQAEARKGIAKGWPKLPAHGADLTEIRAYLTQAVQLPIGYEVYSAERHGQYGSDPMVVTIRTPGDAKDIRVRFRNQRDASKPAGLRGAFVEATSGATRMRHPSGPQAMDAYTMLCALAQVAEDSTIADDTADWIANYLEGADIIRGSLAHPEQRYDTLLELRRRREFGRSQAQAYIRGDLPPGELWTLLVDDHAERQWIRAREFASWVRHVGGHGRIAQHTLDALIKEAGGKRQQWEENRRGKGFSHIILIMYSVPTVQAVPSLYARAGNIG